MRMHVVVLGRVQGVGFRWFVREAARRLELAGWVKNREDGGVEIIADGPEASVLSLREKLRKGPHGAHVSDVTELEAQSGTLPEPFAIVR